MRYVVMADVHGSCLAFSAVLADLEHGGGADAVVDLGDRILRPI